MLAEHESIIIKTISRSLTPFIQIFALYVIMHGHSSPGGGFQGGIILGASYILLTLSLGVNEVKRRFNERLLTMFTSLGVFIYASIGILCLILGANFLDYGILPIAEPRAMGVLGIEVGVGITVMAVMLSIFHDLITFE
ncbi:sodium:proton antiporter [bacterium]|nr:sodium:proton antiporter [bacterium]